MSSHLRKRMATYNWTTISVIALVGLLFVVALFTNRGKAQRAFDPNSNAPDGLLLLRLWLEDLNYDVRMQSQIAFDLPTQPKSLLLIYPGTRGYSEPEAERLYQWIEVGNSAAFFVYDPVDEVLGKRFAFAADGFTLDEEQITQPLLADHKALAKTILKTNRGFGSALAVQDAPNTVTAISTLDGQPVVAVRQIGKGTLWLMSSHYLFTNQQLSAEDVGAHFIPLLRTVPDHGMIQLDTFHLFGSLLGDKQEINSIQDWLYYTAWGNATLFAALVVGLFLVLQGRRLGPALPTQEQMRRREAAEYVVAMANLYRRGSVTADVAAYQKQRLKQAVGRPLHLGSDLPDAAFIQALRTHDPRFDEARIDTLTQLLSALDHADDASLIESADEIDRFLKEVGR